MIEAREFVQRVNTCLANQGWSRGIGEVSSALLRHLRRKGGPVSVPDLVQVVPRRYLEVNGINHGDLLAVLDRELKGIRSVKMQDDHQEENPQRERPTYSITVNNSGSIVGHIGSPGASLEVEHLQLLNLPVNIEQARALADDPEIQRILKSNSNSTQKRSKLSDLIMKKVPGITRELAIQTGAGLMAAAAQGVI